MRIALLGPVRVDGNVDGLSPRDRTVLSALAISTDRAASVDLLSEALWGDEPPASSVKIVHGCISRLRKLLGQDAIETAPDGYRLTVADDDVDLRRFETMVTQARELLALGEPDRAEHVLHTAMELWRGRALTDLDDWHRARVERERLRGVQEQAQELRVDALLRAGRPHDALGPAVRLVEEEPLRESRWCLLARAQYQCGQAAEALDTITRARAVLARELGLDLGPALEELQQQVLVHDDALAVPEARPTSTTRCPWPGLVAFGSGDADDFLGREREVETCLERLRDQGLLVVAGPSGSGKSSLVRAGVTSRLRADGAEVVVLTAGPTLDRELPAVQDRPDVVVVDQLEALTAPDVDDADLVRVVELLASQVYRSALVLTVRSDRLGEFAAGPLAGIVERGLLLLGPMDEDALRRVIEEPARRAGLVVEPGLVDLLVTEVTREPGALPMLSHVLRSTWERREGRTLTTAGYAAAGGIRGAVARTAEDVHARIDERRRAVMRDLLLRMVNVGEDGALVAVPLSRTHVDEDPTRRAIAERLVAARLVTADRQFLSLAHESLARAWPRLQSWLDEDVVGQRLLRHLSVAATDWDDLGRPDSELYRGMRLAEALEWRERRSPTLTGVEQAFLDASHELTVREQRRVEARAERTARTNERLRRALRIGTLLGAAALVAGIIAVAAAVQANDSATTAGAQRLGAEALATDDIHTALSLAFDATELADTPGTRANLLELLGRSPAVVGAIRPEGAGGLGTVSVSPDGRTLATYDDTNTLRFLDVGTHAVRAELPFRDVPLHPDEELRGTTEGVFGTTAFHPTGGHVLATVTTLGGRPVRLLDAATFEELPEERQPWLPSGGVLPWDAAWSPQGDRFAVVMDRFSLLEPPAQDSLVLIWDADDLSNPTVVELPSASHSLAWSPDGRWLYVGTEAPPPAAASFEATTSVVDTHAGVVARSIDDVGHPIALHPDGNLLAGSPGRSSPGELVVVDVTDDSTHARFATGTANVGAVDYSDDGSRLAAGGDDGSIVVWDVDTTRVVERFDGHGAAVGGVGFTPDGTTLASVGADRLTLLWDLTGRRRFVQLLADVPQEPDGSGFWQVRPLATVSPSGDRVIHVGAWRREISSIGVAVQAVDVSSETMTEPVPWRTTFPWVSTAWLADDTVLLGDRGDLVSVWSVQGRPAPEKEEELRLAQLSRRQGKAGGAGLIGAHPSGDWIVAVSAQGRYVSVWSTSTWQQIGSSSMGLIDGELEAEGVQLSRYGIRTIPVSTDGQRAATFGGRHPRVEHSATIVAPPTDVLVLIDLGRDHETDRRQVAHFVDLDFDAIAAAFSPDDETLAVVGRRGHVALVDVATGKLVAPPVPGHDGDARSVAWVGSDPGNQVVATGGDDGRVRLWNGTTGAPLGRVAVTAPDQSTFVGTRPGTDTVVVATSGGDVFGFDARSDCWVAAARAIARPDAPGVELAAAGPPDLASCGAAPVAQRPIERTSVM